MKYLIYGILLVGVLVGSPVGCDSDKKDGAGDDAGADTQAQKEKSAEKKQKNKQKKQDQESDRPSAASAESGTIDAKPPLEIDSYLTTDDLTKIADVSKAESTELPGREPSPDYNAKRIRPAEDNGYGAGLQVWALDDAKKTSSRLSEFRSQYLNVTKLSELEKKSELSKKLGKEAFVSKRGGIRNVVFRLSEPPRVVAVSCSIESCASTEDALKLANRVRKRIAGSDAESKK